MLCFSWFLFFLFLCPRRLIFLFSSLFSLSPSQVTSLLCHIPTAFYGLWSFLLAAAGPAWFPAVRTIFSAPWNFTHFFFFSFLSSLFSFLFLLTGKLWLSHPRFCLMIDFSFLFALHLSSYFSHSSEKRTPLPVTYYLSFSLSLPLFFSLFL